MNSLYQAPLKESLFILDKVLDWRKLFAHATFAHVDAELATAVLTEGARFAADILAPLNQAGDKQESRLIDGKVITPDGFKEAYKQFAEAGWIGLDMPEEYGGQNLPLAIQVAFAEMVNGACISFAMLPIMQRAASSLLMEHGSKAFVDRVVPNLVTGKWGATICISEAEAGSDVGRIRTMAVQQEDGNYLVSGSKIFITYADHDFTEQIVHLVLARTPGAPPGTRGISLFLVPKLGFDSGENNNVSVSRVEKKMGLKASPTCVLDLDQAVGYRIGEESLGLKCMFTMVNLMRLEVSIQGPAIASAATQKALHYACERRQGGHPDQVPLNIIEHADVRRMLFIMRARTEAMRALVYETAFNLDIGRVAEDHQERLRASQLAEFLLPVCKAAGSETGFDVASLAVQVFAGHGYIADSGVEQYVRDARVSMIYEGTNGIQALDLVTRKLLKDDAIRYHLFAEGVSQDLSENANNVYSQTVMRALKAALADLEDCTTYLMDMKGRSLRDLEAGATDYLSLLALVAGGWMWLRMISSVDEDTEFGKAKIAIANFYAEYLMPESVVLSSRIHTGAKTLDSLDGDTLVGH
jgi:3-(methylsulfanyl)propanoyl-CoA dehydrogenase